ncbi:MAG: hypothetical protein RLZZ241_904 [Bacteroidota bacterium]|jgi:outer membrane protein OmpA-like peptidoglycan-associated protein
MEHSNNRFYQKFMIMICICAFAPNMGNAQSISINRRKIGDYKPSNQLTMTQKDSVVTSSWVFGFGFNVVDDSGNIRSGLNDLGNQWNFGTFPSLISAGYYFENGLGVELIGTINNYKAGKTVDLAVLSEDYPYWAIDSRLSYSLTALIGETGIFDPYLGVGVGYAKASDVSRPTLNAGLGLRTWFTKYIGLDLNATGKWKMNNVGTNHLQLGAALIVRSGAKHELSAAGVEKVALYNQQLEEERQRLDSVARAKAAAEAEEERLNQERLRQEAEAEAARLAAQKPDLKALQAELDEKGFPDYAFNTASLNANTKAILANVAAFMNTNNTLSFEVQGHADSRGSIAYNQVLSEKRAQSVINYLVSLGISRDRLRLKGFGESALLNSCNGRERCSEADHKLNRRCEIKIIGSDDPVIKL